MTVRYRVADIDLFDYDNENDHATLEDAEIAAIGQSLSDRVIAVFDLETADGDCAGDIVALVAYQVVYRP